MYAFINWFSGLATADAIILSILFPLFIISSVQLYIKVAEQIKGRDRFRRKLPPDFKRMDGYV